MERKFGLRRIYRISDFNSLEISDELSNIPENLAMNPEFISTLQFMLITEFEHMYRTYGTMTTGLNALGKEEAIEVLEQMKKDLQSKLEKIIRGE